MLIIVSSCVEAHSQLKSNKMSSPPQSLVNAFKRLLVSTDETLFGRLRQLLRRASFDDDCQRTHLQLLDRGVDFLMCWASMRADGYAPDANRLYAAVLRTIPLPHLYLAEEEFTSLPSHPPDCASVT